MLRVCDVMTSNVLTLDPAMTLREVVELFAANHVTGAPVLAGGRVVGVISAAEVLLAGAETPRAAVLSGGEDGASEWPEPEPWAADDESTSQFFRSSLDEELTIEPRTEEWLDRLTAGELMTRNLCSLPPDASVVEAANYMLWASVHRILVIEGEALLGILSTSDIVRAVAQRRL